MSKKDFSKEIKKAHQETVPDDIFDRGSKGPVVRREIALGTKAIQDARAVPVDKIKPDPNQPRSNISQESIEELAESIKVHGVLEPLAVEYLPKKDFYQIIAGERRYQASTLAGLTEVPCLIHENLDNNKRRAIQLVENLQREDLSPIDKARALIGFKGNRKWEAVERDTGLSRPRRKQFTALLNLPEEIQKNIVSIGTKRGKKEFTEFHARALLSLRKEPDKQKKLFELITDSKSPLTGREAQERAKDLKGSPKLMTLVVKYASKEELIQKLEDEIKKLKGS